MKNLVILGGVVALLIHVSEARAARTDMSGSFPAASLCRQVGSAGSLVDFANGVLANNSTTEFLTVDCPIPGGGDAPFQARVLVIDDSPSPLSCTLRAEDAATELVFTTTVTSTFDDSGSHSLETTSPVQQFEHGQMHMTCTIPPTDTAGNRSGLVTYMVNQSASPPDAKHRRGYHTFPGSKCTKMNPGAAGTPFIAADGSLGNGAPSSSGSSLLVDCPSITVDSQTGASKSDSAVWYVDNAPSAVHCTMRAEMELSDVSNQRTLVSNFDDVAAHAFAFSGANAITLSPSGVVHTYCVLPQKDNTGRASYVIGYGLAMVNEVNDPGGLPVQPLKRYPASHCTPVFGSVVKDVEGAVANPAIGASTQIICPILQWPFGAAQGAHPGNFKINFVDNSASNWINCTYEAFASISGAVSRESFILSGLANVHSQVSEPGIPELRPGYALLSCTIPGRASASEAPSRILSYEGF